jgi:hypothetical protein
LPDVDYEVEIPKKTVKLPKKPELSINMPKAGMNVQVPKKPDVKFTKPKVEMKVPSPPKVKMMSPPKVKMQVPKMKAPKLEQKIDLQQPEIEMP